jgi:hypothetical protein
MRYLVLTGAVVLSLPSLALAGPVYGSVFFNGAALKAAAITVACGGETVKGATLDDGTYRLRVPEGKCTFTVAGQPFGTATAEIVSSTGSVRYVFDVVKGDGGYELRKQ